MVAASSSDAGPSDPNRGAGATPATPAAAHPAFPSAQALARHEPTPPDSAATLWKQITDAGTPEALDHLSAMLSSLTTSTKGSNHPDRGLLLLKDVDLSAVPDAQVPHITLGLTYILSERIKADPKSRDTLELALRLFVYGSPEQFRMAPTPLTELAWGVLRASQAAKELSRALGPLQELLARSANGVYFNAVHAVFLEACLLMRNISLGYQSLNVLYANVHEGTNVVDVLTYYHHAGATAAAAGDYARASELLTFGAAVPGETPSAIRLACAKRALLCEVLSTGKHLQFPKDISQSMNRFIEKGMEAYSKLVKAFAAGNWQGVRDIATNTDNIATYERDCNHGLVAQITRSVTKRRILNLRRTYSRLSLDDLSAKVEASPDAVRNDILAMVSGGEIQATIEGSPAIVTFMDDDDYASPAKMRELVAAHQLAQDVTTDLQYSNRAMMLSRKWLGKQVRSIENKTQRRGGVEPLKSRMDFEAGDDIGMPPVRGVGSNLDDMGF